MESYLIFCYFDFDRPSVQRPAYLRNICLQLQELAGKGLFLGFGLLVGQGSKGGKPRNLAAPLMFCPVQLEPEADSPSEMNYEILWEGISLNYDLLTASTARQVVRKCPRGPGGYRPRRFAPCR